MYFNVTMSTVGPTETDTYAPGTTTTDTIVSKFSFIYCLNIHTLLSAKYNDTTVKD